MDVVDVEAMAQLKYGEYISPESANLSSYIYPNALNVHTVNAPVDA